MQKDSIPESVAMSGAQVYPAGQVQPLWALPQRHEQITDVLASRPVHQGATGGSTGVELPGTTQPVVEAVERGIPADSCPYGQEVSPWKWFTRQRPPPQDAFSVSYETARTS
jgi:hypothetical protein